MFEEGQSNGGGLCGGKILQVGARDAHKIHARWKKEPENILVYRKPNNPAADRAANEIILYLLNRHYRVFLEIPEYDKFLKHCLGEEIEFTSSPTPTLQHPLINQESNQTEENELKIKHSDVVSTNDSSSEQIEEKQNKMGRLEWIALQDPLNDLKVNFTGMLSDEGKAESLLVPTPNMHLQKHLSESQRSISNSPQVLTNTQLDDINKQQTPQNPYLLQQSSSSTSIQSYRSQALFSLDPFIVACSRQEMRMSDIDCMIVIGGDGTLLRASGLFTASESSAPYSLSSIPPPIVPFHGGTMGFLTPFSLDNPTEVLKMVFENWKTQTFSLQERGRLVCKVIDTNDYEEPKKDIEKDDRGIKTKNKKEEDKSEEQKVINPKENNDDEDDNASTNSQQSSISGEYAEVNSKLLLECHVLNEAVVSGVVSRLETLQLCIDGSYTTLVQACGLIIATSTGSSAFSASAGGSIVHPALAAMLITPVCPHSLSFRPMIIPDGSSLLVRVPPEVKHTPVVSFDGRGMFMLRRGHVIHITRSSSPLMLLCNESPVADWVGALDKCLSFNRRIAQQAELAEISVNNRTGKQKFEQELMKKVQIAKSNYIDQQELEDEEARKKKQSSTDLQTAGNSFKASPHSVSSKGNNVQGFTKVNNRFSLQKSPSFIIAHQIPEKNTDNINSLQTGESTLHQQIRASGGKAKIATPGKEIQRQLRSMLKLHSSKSTYILRDPSLDLQFSIPQTTQPIHSNLHETQKVADKPIQGAEMKDKNAKKK